MRQSSAKTIEAPRWRNLTDRNRSNHQSQQSGNADTPFGPNAAVTEMVPSGLTAFDVTWAELNATLQQGGRVTRRHDRHHRPGVQAQREWRTSSPERTVLWLQLRRPSPKSCERCREMLYGRSSGDLATVMTCRCWCSRREESPADR